MLPAPSSLLALRPDDEKLAAALAEKLVTIEPLAA